MFHASGLNAMDAREMSSDGLLKSIQAEDMVEEKQVAQNFFCELASKHLRVPVLN